MHYQTNHTAKFWLQRFGTPRCARNYHYYAYEYLDELSFLPSALKVFNGWRCAPKLLKEVSLELRKRGWQGTGAFQMLWLPPFVGAGEKDNFGCYVLHVKQRNDGISWLASPVTLPFHRLFQPDAAVYPPPDPTDPKTKLRRMGGVRWLSDL
ncbi:MAG: hypothetical protein AMXMBFR7_17530 [Planctomycetota bacterium]